ncbi:hypothetical protein ZWY2020_028487 [Hordeum vulgare]|nr:hypothetical protein ZWY2020_028487 [Hordeum vulgare]
MDGAALDDVIRWLLEARIGLTMHPVQLSDAEIRSLCTSANDVFLSQPNLLEHEALIKVCGKGARFLPNPPLPPARTSKITRGFLSVIDRRLCAPSVGHLMS